MKSLLTSFLVFVLVTGFSFSPVFSVFAQVTQVDGAQPVQEDQPPKPTTNKFQLRTVVETNRLQQLHTITETAEERADLVRPQAFDVATKPYNDPSVQDGLKVRPQQLERRVITLPPRPEPPTSDTDEVVTFTELKKQYRRDVSNLEARRALMVQLIELLIKHGQQLKDRVQTFPVIHSDLEDSILAEIDADIATLEELKARVLLAESVEELKMLADKASKYRHDFTQRKVRRLLLIAQFGLFEHRTLVTIEERSLAIDARLTELETNGYNVQRARKLLFDANKLITDTRDFIHTEKQRVNSQDIDETLLRDLKSSLDFIRGNIKSIYALFRDVAAEVRNLTPQPSGQVLPGSPPSDPTPDPTQSDPNAIQL
ncbi:MAG: hypothetical protein COU08_00570 [Candidatus Harrisonbacteria bacterium CG10_big_fil_rev_8_21_14_0_10_42_17]|uniref:DUF5667 domain-containing protein n=1 Tax=Candidatus Harrisonbacteria bacterium CG10_big_fil_rev_8_21_14_0_10_42_17 TaxID=1974584 RepID=A0A2M6WJ29_9BACT|nr:MAG: hypothetical protein COU08_00570 [Candidatus Harrisonbacteria bacterium CG10_big_fil_rev_8_21_14_0_10_42_17]